MYFLFCLLMKFLKWTIGGYYFEFEGMKILEFNRVDWDTNKKCIFILTNMLCTKNIFWVVECKWSWHVFVSFFWCAFYHIAVAFRFWNISDPTITKQLFESKLCYTKPLQKLFMVNKTKFTCLISCCSHWDIWFHSHRVDTFFFVQ